MLDSLKGLAGTNKAQKQADDLQSLISAAKEERSALAAMLTETYGTAAGRGREERLGGLLTWPATRSCGWWSRGRGARRCRRSGGLHDLLAYRFC